MSGRRWREKRANGKRKVDPHEESITDAGHVRKLQDLVDDGVGFVNDKVILSR